MAVGTRASKRGETNVVLIIQSDLRTEADMDVSDGVI